MGRTRRHRLLVAVCGMALLAGACNSDDDLPEGLRDIRDSDPDVSETEPDEPADDEPDELEPDPEPEPDPDEDDDPEADDPEASREGTEVIDGVFLAEDAFQINDDLDLDADAQRDLLDFALDAYLYSISSFDTGEWEADELRRYYAQEGLEGTLNSLERNREEGLRQVNHGAVIEFTRITTAGGGDVVIATCVAVGPDAGIVDRESGEYVFEVEEAHRLMGFLLALTEVEGDLVDWRIVASGGSDGVSCP